MYEATVLQEKAQMFEQRAENAIEPISKRHFKEMAAHYRSLAVEHLALKLSIPNRNPGFLLRRAGLLRQKAGEPHHTSLISCWGFQGPVLIHNAAERIYSAQAALCCPR